jgi:putative phosphoesterase
LRPTAKEFLRSCDHIIHGGDIAEPGILTELATLAPITAVRGNNDQHAWADKLPATEFIKIDDISIYIIHNLAELNIDPSTADVQVVISGHSHKPSIAEREGVLFVNPGSAGPRRFKLPISIAELIIAGSSVSARIIELGPR